MRYVDLWILLFCYCPCLLMIFLILLLLSMNMDSGMIYFMLNRQNMILSQYCIAAYYHHLELNMFVMFFMLLLALNLYANDQYVVVIDSGYSMIDCKEIINGSCTRLFFLLFKFLKMNSNFKFKYFNRLFIYHYKNIKKDKK